MRFGRRRSARDKAADQAPDQQEPTLTADAASAGPADGQTPEAVALRVRDTVTADVLRRHLDPDEPAAPPGR